MSTREYYASALEGSGRIPTPFDGIISIQAFSALEAAVGSGNPDPDEPVPTPDTVQDTPDNPEEPSSPKTGFAPNRDMTRAEGGGEPL